MENRKRYDAQRTTGPEKASRCDWRCCDGSQDCNRRDQGQSEIRPGSLWESRGEGARCCVDQRTAQRDRAQGRRSEVAMMVPSTARWDMAKARANDLTKAYSVPPIPVLEIAESNGVDVVFTGFGEHNSTVAGLCDFEHARLYVNKDDLGERQFFTIAHELGHWLLHKDIFIADPERYPVLPRFQSASRNDPLEQEANCFAANLLVPEKLLKPVNSAPVSALASIFKVSKTMMEFRINNVG